MDPMLLMMLASIGLQFFTNSKNNEKSRELQDSQREYQKAAQYKQFERMRKLQSEQAKLKMDLEAEIHKDRMAKIENQYDETLNGLIDEIALKNWPLNILPFIMRGESFGSLICGGSKTIAIHCVLAPSNNKSFNKLIYQKLDFMIESEMNINWNTQSTHPVVYYGGAWKKITSSEDDILTDIQLLHTQLTHIPCLIIFPHFEEKGVTFKVNIWGMGDDKPAFVITPPAGLFSYEDSYSKNVSFEFSEVSGSDFYCTTIEEFVPFIEQMIGFVADKYFWSIYHVAPALPKYLVNSSSSYDLANVRSLYLTEMTSQQDESVSCSDVRHQIDYLESVSPIFDDTQKKKLESDMLGYANNFFSQSGIPSTFTSLADLRRYIDVRELAQTSNEYAGVQDVDSLDCTAVNEDVFDLSEYALKFKSFIDDGAERFNKETVSLYVRHKDYRFFDLHIYDVERKCFFSSNDDGFDYNIIARKVKNMHNVKSVFKNSTSSYIICRYDRLDRLVEVLQNKDLLIY